MEITTQRDLIRGLSKRWRDQYEPFKDDRPPFSVRNGHQKLLNKKDIADKLDDLDVESATPEDVAAIIGNESWTRLTCDECGKDVDAVLTLGRGKGKGGESRTASICQACTQKAASISWMNEKG